MHQLNAVHVKTFQLKWWTVAPVAPLKIQIIHWKMRSTGRRSQVVNAIENRLNAFAYKQTVHMRLWYCLTVILHHSIWFDVRMHVVPISELLLTAKKKREKEMSWIFSYEFSQSLELIDWHFELLSLLICPKCSPNSIKSKATSWIAPELFPPLRKFQTECFYQNLFSFTTYMPNGSDFSHLQRWYDQIYSQLCRISNANTRKHHRVSI